jgi:hypothetical protein
MKYVLTHADVCCRILTYADVYDACWRMLPYADVCWRMLTYADAYDACWRMQRRATKVVNAAAQNWTARHMLTYVDECWQMLTNADVCLRTGCKRGCTQLNCSLGGPLATHIGGCCSKVPTSAPSGGTQFTCFTGTNVQMLTPTSAASGSEGGCNQNWRMLMYADVCWRMLTYADVCWRMLTYADVCWRMLTYAGIRSWRRQHVYTQNMLTYADVCWRMLADVCWRMLTYAGIRSWRRQHVYNQQSAVRGGEPR